MYCRNDPKFSDKYVWANSADQDQTAPICYSICIFLKKYSKVWPLYLNFRCITGKFSGIRNFRSFQYAKKLFPKESAWRVILQ